ncbi:acyl-coenzyme A thioesterase 1 isoform X1 [Anolis carolinensis]|uniref:acyl-coenzyme A thioesterase 1 isoform X1 n=2 Tax=Anolis carolinensis TaxID=28377 RepID=UPI002F2B2C82
MFPACWSPLKPCFGPRLLGLKRLSALFLSRFSSSMEAPRILFSPSGRSLFDEPLHLSVEGLPPGQEVTLEASLEDERQELFEARAFYRADAEGRLDVSRSPALEGEGGSFSGLEPMGLLWSLRKPMRRLVKRDVRRPFVLKVDVRGGGPAEAPGPLLAHAAHERAFLGEGTRRIPVREGALRGTLFLPPGDGPFPGIIDLYGTGGGLPEYRACLLANRGLAMFALAYYGFEDLPKQLKDLHLEYFEEGVNYMLKHPMVKGPGIGLLGHSKAGDLCISMASFLKGIIAIVTVNGSVVNVGAALHYKDITIPPIGIDAKRAKIDSAGVFDIIDVLDNPLEGEGCKSFIPLERAEGRFLFIVGQDDHNWKSEFYANEGSKRLQAHGKLKPEIICYPGAGHYIEPPYMPYCPVSMHFLVGHPVMWGGEPKAHAAAQVDAWQQIQAFFHKHLGGEQGVKESRL